MMKITAREVLGTSCFCIAALLAGCGGGSKSSNTDGGGNAPALTLPLTELRTEITTTNFFAVGNNAFAALASVSRLAGPVDNLVSGAPVNAAATRGAASPVLGLLYLAMKNPAPRMAAGVEQTVPCETGGSIKVTGTMANPDRLTQGDAVSLAANACTLASLTVNGNFTLAVKQLNGIPGESSAWSGVMDVVYSQFAVASAAGTVVASGDMELNVSQSSANNQVLAMAGKLLQVRDEPVGAPAVERTVRSYRADSTLSGDNSRISGNYTLGGTSSRHGAYLVGVVTDVPFESTGGGFPAAGAMTITGAQSTATATAGRQGSFPGLGVALRNSSGTVFVSQFLDAGALSSFY